MRRLPHHLALRRLYRMSPQGIGSHIKHDGARFFFVPGEGAPFFIPPFGLSVRVTHQPTDLDEGEVRRLNVYLSDGVTRIGYADREPPT